MKLKKRRISPLMALNVLGLSAFALVVLLPVMSVFSEAFSSEAYVISGRVSFWPLGFQTDTVRYVLGKVEFINSFRVSIFVTILGSLLAMSMTVTAAYPLSKPGLRGRKPILYLYVVVMLFSAGMVPNYLLFRALGLVNTIWALVFSGTFSVYNMFIMKNYMESLPEAVEESALIDGASNLRVLVSIVLPMSTPVLATLTLFYAVGYWNSYFAGVMYITNPSLKPLQQYLMDMINAANNTVNASGSQSDMAEQVANMASKSIQAATIVVSVVPILLVYPFLQRYFVKGITIGSVKG